MAQFYKTKSPECIEQIIGVLRRSPPPKSDPNTAIGFLAELFRSSPDTRATILAQSSTQYEQAAELLALLRAGLPDDARSFAKANGLVGLLTNLQSSGVKQIASMPRARSPGENDLLIGAYMESGNVAFIRSVLANFADATEQMTADAIRMGLMMSKFQNMAAPGREPAMVKAACARYNCKTDGRQMQRLLAMSTAFWALSSLSRTDAGVRGELSKVFGDDPKLKKTLAVEQTAFGNYVLMFAVFSGLKGGRENPEQERAYVGIVQSLDTFENLGSANAAFAPLESLGKAMPPSGKAKK